mgnify:CR=1 FL=1|tara:strand:+ start:56 stop:226 length:171 start_codon:yes stop_codon:yes gene_type:complete
MKHLEDRGISYGEHMILAFTYAYKLGIMTIVAIIHGILPFMFETYVSDKLKELNKK